MIVVNADVTTTTTTNPVESDWVQSLEKFDEVRRAEIASIRAFVESQVPMIGGRVLDFGAGKPGTCREPQPYRDLMPVCVEYVPFDLGDQIPVGPFDTILCTQVIQFVKDPRRLLNDFREWLAPEGVLILTYPTCWDECEPDDVHRFTRSGMDRLLRAARFTPRIHYRRAEVRLGVFAFALGYGVTATVRT